MEQIKSSTSLRCHLDKVTPFKDFGDYFKRFSVLDFFVGISIILSPLYVVRINFWGVPTTLLEIVLLFTFLVWFWQRKSIVLPISSLIRALARIKVLERSERFSSWPVAMLILGVAIATIVSPDQRGALGILKAYFLEPILFFYLLTDIRKQETACLPVRQGSRRQETIITSLIITALYLSIWGIMQVVFGLGVVTSQEQLAGRAHGPFNSGNALALFLVPVFLLALGRLSALARGDLANSQGLPLRIIGLSGLTLTILIGILFSKSQGGLIGLIGAIGLVGLIWLVTKTSWRLRLKHLWLIIPIYLIIVIGGLSQISRFTPKNNNPWLRPINDTLIPRLCLWEGAVNLLKDRPLLGAGPNGFKSLYSQKYFTCDAEALQYPHNFILNFWTETGIFGLLGMLAILAILLRRQSQIFLTSPVTEKKVLALSLIAIVFYWLIHGLVDVPYLKNDLSLQFWVMMVLGTLNSEDSQEGFLGKAD